MFHSNFTDISNTYKITLDKLQPMFNQSTNDCLENSKVYQLGLMANWEGFSAAGVG